jgi:hypothetical protein
VPVVRATQHIQRRALVGTNRLGGQGHAFVRLEPLAIIERSAAGERTIPLHGWTIRQTTVLLLLAFALGVLVAMLLGRRR